MSLGEIDHARAIYVYAAHTLDQRSDEDFWMKWQQFEVQNGNEDTYRDLCGMNGTVSASLNQVFFCDQSQKRKEEDNSCFGALDRLKRLRKA